MHNGSKLLLLGLAAAAAIAGCSSDDEDTLGPNVAANIAVGAGNNQVALLGDSLTDSVAVLVTNARGNPVSGAAVTWTVASGGGSVTPATSTTGTTGIARAKWVLGKGATGANTLTASVQGVTGTAGFTATANPLSFSATMSGQQERPTPNTSTATAQALFSWNGSQLTYVVTVNGNLTGNVTGAHIHGPAADSLTNAAVILNFNPNTTVATGTVAQGTATATSGQLPVATVSLDSVITLMKARKAYVNVHTQTNPGGELRGTVKSP